MKNGLYLAQVKALDGANFPPSGIVILRNGVLLGGGPYMYYTGSYTLKEGYFKGEFILNQHTPAPGGHIFFGAEDVGMGMSGTYRGDEAELSGTALIGKRSVTVQVTLRKLADA
jgi:hypothetical protein